ncbi:hypothetical protein TSOC_014102, partial [Tetrabaena socialis]
TQNQVALSGVWGAICADGWDDADADVACRQLDFSAGLDASGRSPFLFPVGQGLSRWRVVHMTRVECPTDQPPPPPAPPPPQPQPSVTPAFQLASGDKEGSTDAAAGIQAPLPQPLPTSSRPPSPKRWRAPAADLSSCPHSTSDASSCHYRDQAAARCFRTRADAATAASSPPPPRAPPAPPLPYNSSSGVVCIYVYYGDLHLAHGMALLPHDACARSAAALTPLLLSEPMGLAPPGLECAGYISKSFSVCGTVADAWVATAWVAGLPVGYGDGWARALVEQVGLAFATYTRELDYDYGSVGGSKSNVHVAVYGPGLAWPAALEPFMLEREVGWDELGLTPSDRTVRTVLLSPPPQSPDWISGEVAAEPMEGDGA